MNAAVVESFERPPRYATFREPVAGDGTVLVRMCAAALSNLVKGQAAGSHYSSASEMPFVPGYDGVGTRLDGSRVYFFGPPAPFGAMAEWSVAVASRTVALPDYVDDATAAALGNPGLASWAALLGRARLQAGESVLSERRDRELPGQRRSRRRSYWARREGDCDRARAGCAGEAARAGRGRDDLVATIG